MKTTKKHFELFKSEVLKWINFFGLYDWQVHFAHGGKDMDLVRARVIYNSMGCICTFFLNTAWNEPKDILSDENIKKAAFHEVCELLLGRLTNIAEGRWGWHKDDLEQETHRVIRILENVVFN